MAQTSLVFVSHDHAWTYPNVNVGVIKYSKWLQRQHAQLHPCVKNGETCANSVAQVEIHESRNRIILPDTIDKYSFQRVLTYLIHEVAQPHTRNITLSDGIHAKDGPQFLETQPHSSYATQIDAIWSNVEWYGGFLVNTFGSTTLTDATALSKLVHLWNVTYILQIDGLQQMCTFMFACYLRYCLERKLPLQISVTANSLFHNIQNQAFVIAQTNVRESPVNPACDAVTSKEIVSKQTLMHSKLPKLPTWL
jgi:hypothetical protein